MDTVKVTGLTGSNVRALEELLFSGGKYTYVDPDRYVDGMWTFKGTTVTVPVPTWATDVVLGKTTATFPVSAAEAYHAVQTMVTHLPRRGHPKASLHAVARKLRAKTGVAA